MSIESIAALAADKAAADLSLRHAVAEAALLGAADIAAIARAAGVTRQTVYRWMVEDVPLRAWRDPDGYTYVGTLTGGPGAFADNLTDLPVADVGVLGDHKRAKIGETVTVEIVTRPHPGRQPLHLHRRMTRVELPSGAVRDTIISPE